MPGLGPGIQRRQCQWGTGCRHGLPGQARQWRIDLGRVNLGILSGAI